MAGATEVVLSNFQECLAAKMIKFLLAFCWSGNNKGILVHDELVLEHVFEEATSANVLVPLSDLLLLFLTFLTFVFYFFLSFLTYY